MATFTLDDWRELTGHDKRAIRKLAGALFDFYPTAKFAGLGPRSVESLIAKGLAEEGPCNGTHSGETGYRLTEKGWLANEWCSGRRMERTPD